MALLFYKLSCPARFFDLRTYESPDIMSGLSAKKIIASNADQSLEVSGPDLHKIVRSEHMPLYRE